MGSPYKRAPGYRPVAPGNLNLLKNLKLISYQVRRSLENLADIQVYSQGSTLSYNDTNLVQNEMYQSTTMNDDYLAPQDDEPTDSDYLLPTTTTTSKNHGEVSHSQI